MKAKPRAEQLRLVRASLETRKRELVDLRKQLATTEEALRREQERALLAEQAAETLRRDLAVAESAAEGARVKLQEALALLDNERAERAQLHTPELQLAVGLFPTIFPAWFRSAVMALALGVIAGCTYPLTCSPTWFRSCAARVQEPVPVRLTAETPDFPFSYILRRGALVVTIPAMPAGRWRVTARRRTPVGLYVDLGAMEITVPSDTSLTEVEIRPTFGRSMGLDAYPVFERIKR